MKNMKLITLLVLIAVSLFCFSPIVPTVRAHNPTWWDYDWDQRLELTINHTLVDDTLTDFPVLVYIDENQINWGDVQNNLDDIRFTDDYLNELDFEIDSFILNWEAWFWVRLPEISSSLDTYFFMYFDNKFCDSGENAEAVWDSGFVMVQHMNDATTSTVLDSTSNDNDGTKLDVNEPIEVTGKIGNAQHYDGFNDLITVLNSESLNPTDELTMEAWINKDLLVEGGSYPLIMAKQHGTQYSFVIYAGNSIRSITFPNSVRRDDIIEGTMNVETWYYVVGTIVGATNTGASYLDGIFDNTLGGDVGEVGDLQTSESDLTSGNTLAGNFFDGLMDELRVSNISRSGAWVGASYYAQSLDLVIIGYHYHPPDTSLRGEFIAAALVASLIFVPLLILVIFAARRK